MKIAVYCGAHYGDDIDYIKAADALGKWIGKNNHTLVYGAGSVGLMGVVADAVLETKGKVIGVVPRFFESQNVVHLGLDEIIWVETMSERKQKMIDLADMFIALPGGVGTLEEIIEVVSLNNLGRINKPYAFYNLRGYYDGMKDIFGKMVDSGFLEKKYLKDIKFINSIKDLERMKK